MACSMQNLYYKCSTKLNNLFNTKSFFLTRVYYVQTVYKQPYSCLVVFRKKEIS